MTEILPDLLEKLDEFAPHRDPIPPDVCRVLGTFVRAWHDALPDHDHNTIYKPPLIRLFGALVGSRDEVLPARDRNTLIKPLLPRLVGTQGSARLTERRAMMAADWLVRVHTPAWLRLAKLIVHAEALEGLPEITSMEQVPSIQGLIELSRRAAEAAWLAAKTAAWDDLPGGFWSDIEVALDGPSAYVGGLKAVRTNSAWIARWRAAVDAARSTAGEAARDATWGVNRNVSWHPAWIAAWAACYDAAQAAALADLKPTQERLQDSARDLLVRMIEATEPTETRP